jgi:hypothetical protein
MQPDPLGLGAADVTNPQSLNRYSYVGNDPVNFVDPLGLMLCFARFMISSTYENGHLVSETWEFLGIFCYGGFGGGGGGGGGGQQSGEQEKQSLPNCDEFVDSLVNIVSSNYGRYQGQPSTFRHVVRQRIGMDMARRAINGVDENGQKYGKFPTPVGFQDNLVGWGQGGDVYRHILFVAGNVLEGALGGWLANEMFEAYDFFQFFGGRDESLAELLADRAGRQVGAAMSSAFDSGDFNKLRETLKSILCK